MLYLGVDAGGTKTLAVISDEDGNVLAEGRAGGANVHNFSIEAGFGNVEAAVKAARESLNLEVGTIIENGCVGLSGLDSEGDRRRVGEYWQEQVGRLGVRTMRIVNDGLVGLRSGTAGAGVCIVSGTGSNCYGISDSRDEVIAGDWGYVLGDQGSGYALGRELLWQTVKELDGRADEWISAKVLEQLGVHSLDELVEWAYKPGEIRIAQIAALSTLRHDEQLSSHPLMAVMTGKILSELELAYLAVVKRLGLVEFDVVVMGGVLRDKGGMGGAFRARIGEVTPGARIVMEEVEPVMGAVALAMGRGSYGKNVVEVGEEVKE